MYAGVYTVLCIALLIASRKQIPNTIRDAWSRHAGHGTGHPAGTIRPPTPRFGRTLDKEAPHSAGLFVS